eukprot:1155971-Pelagomonas_calceolata.AAC.1
MQSLLKNSQQVANLPGKPISRPACQIHRRACCTVSASGRGDAIPDTTDRRTLMATGLMASFATVSTTSSRACLAEMLLPVLAQDVHTYYVPVCPQGTFGLPRGAIAEESSPKASSLGRTESSPRHLDRHLDPTMPSSRKALFLESVRSMRIVLTVAVEWPLSKQQLSKQQPQSCLHQVKGWKTVSCEILAARCCSQSAMESGSKKLEARVCPKKEICTLPRNLHVSFLMQPLATCAFRQAHVFQH